MTDAELLRTYARDRDQAAFAELVRRHSALVYHAARRQVGGDHHRAQELTQMVFLALARRAGALAHHPAVVAWLFRTTRLMALKSNQAEARRLARESASALDPALTPADGLAETAVWSRMEPLLDEALADLAESDRTAILLRHFSGHAYAEVGAALGLAENAARMRVERALEKLRRALAKRGVTSTAAALGLALEAHAVTPAPIGLRAFLPPQSEAFSGGLTGTAFSLIMNSKLKVSLAALLLVAATGGVFLWWNGYRDDTDTSVQAAGSPPNAVSVTHTATNAPESLPENAFSTRSGLFSAEEQAIIDKLRSLTSETYMAYLQALIQTNPDLETISAAIEDKIGVKLDPARLNSVNAVTLFHQSLGELIEKRPRAVLAALALAGDWEQNGFAFMLSAVLSRTPSITAQNVGSWLPDTETGRDIVAFLRVRDGDEAPAAATRLLGAAVEPRQRTARLRVLSALWSGNEIGGALAWAGANLVSQDRAVFIAGYSSSIAIRDADSALTMLDQLRGDPAYALSLRWSLQELMRQNRTAEVARLVESTTGAQREGVIGTFAENWAQRHDQAALLDWLATRTDADLGIALRASAAWLSQENRRILFEHLGNSPSPLVEQALALAARSGSTYGKSSVLGAYELLDWLATRPGAAPLSPEGTETQKVIWESMQKMIAHGVTSEWASPDKISLWINRLPFATPADRDAMRQHLVEVKGLPPRSAVSTP